MEILVRNVQQSQSVWDLRAASSILADQLAAAFERGDAHSRDGEEVYELQRAVGYQRRVTDILDLLIQVQK